MFLALSGSPPMVVLNFTASPDTDLGFKISELQILMVSSHPTAADEWSSSISETLTGRSAGDFMRASFATDFLVGDP